MLDYTHLEALLAVEREGSFDGAGRKLGMSAIGVARRIQKLERRLGIKLLLRKPTKPSPAGEALCRYTEDVIKLETDFIQEHRNRGLQPDKGHSRYNIAIDEDSMTSWFPQVLNDHHNSKNQKILDITRKDIDHTMDLLKSGRAIAAVSSSNELIHGFKSFHLCSMTYVAVASPNFIEKYFPDGITLNAISDAPAIRYCNNDGRILQWLENTFEKTTKISFVRLPSFPAIIDACAKGAGWAVISKNQLEKHSTQYSLTELVVNTPLTKELYWHVSTAIADTLADLTKSVRNATRDHS